MAIQLPVLRESASLRPPGRSPKSADGNKASVGRTLRVGELARLAGKTVRALHLYEERGLLDPIERSRFLLALSAIFSMDA